ncbi:MAG: hypothetical protein CMJ58_08250 [Planctomycetaceae bacterium]|nr:hypothetical protein [Planctomycetaceae bacterium]
MKNTLTLTFFIFSLVSACILAASTAHADSFGGGANQFDISFVSIGDPNNPDDTTGEPNPAGKVEYAYRMGKFEISRDMITKANNGGGLGITMDVLGIVTAGARDDMPATGVSWFEAATFVNWLNTSQGHQAAYNFDGAGNFQLWTSAEAWQTGGENLFRHKDAFYFLPSMDEWYKAAYFDASSNTYFNYPTGSDTAPAAVASGTAPDTAVYDQSLSQGPADITLAGGLSPYGTVGQGGNVYEWEETERDLLNDSSLSARGFRGGAWNLNSDFLLWSGRFDVAPRNGFFNIGFRVASIPEPSTVLLGALATGGLLVWRRR